MSASALTIHARFIQFSLLLLFGVPSLICSLYIMYNVITVRSFRLRFQNQTLFVLIFVVLIDILLNLTVTLRYVFKIEGNYLNQLEIDLKQLGNLLFIARILSFLEELPKCRPCDLKR